MPQTSAIIQALFTSLRNARKGTTLVLDRATLEVTSAAALLDLFTQQLAITSFTLEDVQLPESVTGNEFAVSGGHADVTLDVRFTEIRGEVAIEALFRATAIAALQKAFPALPADFFVAIDSSGGTARVSVPGLTTSLTLTSPRYGIAGRVAPISGLVTMSAAPRVDGQAAPPDGPRELLVEVPTAVSGARVAPLATGWTFDDLAWLMPGLALLAPFEHILPIKRLGLRGFGLSLYPDAPSLSSITLDVADTARPGQPLWTAAGDKVKLTDVVLTVDLMISSDGVLSVPGTGSVQGNFLLGSLLLEAQIPCPPTAVWSLTAYPDLSLTALDEIATLLPGGSSFHDLLPAGLAALGDFAFTYIRIAVDVSAFSLVEFTIALTSTASWKLVPGVLELTSLRMSLTIGAARSVTGTVTGTVQLPEGADIVVSFGRNTPQLPWRLDVISPAIALPSLRQLAKLAQGEKLGALVKAGGLDGQHFVMTNLNIGVTISPTKLTNLGLTLQLADAQAPLVPALNWELIPDVLTLTQFSFGFQVTWGAVVKKAVFGTFVLNGLEFGVKFAAETTAGAAADGLIAEYSAQGASGRVNVKHLLASIAPTVAAELPDGLEIDLADAVLAYLNTGGTKKFLFAMDIAVELPVSGLPLVGKALPADAMVGVKNLKVVVASAALSAQDVAFINGMSAKPVLTPAAAGASGAVIPAGFSMAAELQLGALSVFMTSPPVRQQGQPLALARADAPGNQGASDPVMWVPVQKTFGPVQIQKVGFSYRGGKLLVVSNLALSAGGLEIDLLGIGVGSPITKPAVTFTIQGLAVSFAEGPVSIMGGMIGTLDPLDFVGALSVRAPELSLSAFAGYAEYEDHPSFFLYGVLDAPIGGPPPFFVTGIAAGVGFNRKLLLPDVSGVATFPLIQWAQGSGTPSMDPAQPVSDQVSQVLTRLAQSGVVAPSVGDYWFAAGVQFTSFEILESFALLTVSLGTHIEIALLGLSTLTLPPDDPKPVARVQLALEAAFSPDKGQLAIAGQLTSASYVFAPDCRLTGGFAFYLWFAREHAGETVVTLGGYNPSFTVPGHYPVVPRVGLSWQTVPELKITGELYFALTSNVVMAGGKLSAVWKGGPVSAWFTYWADFLMTFSPFHYYVDGGIDLGASFTVDLALVSVSVTIHVGVAIELWGPPFAGRATVNLSVISFTILFNDHEPDTATSIPWAQFVRQLLPAQPAKPVSRAVRAVGASAAVRAEAAEPAPAAVVQINVTSGLVKTLDPAPDAPVYLVTAETFRCTVLTVIPSKKVEFPTPASLAYAPDREQPLDQDGNPVTVATGFGAGPAGLPAAQFQPTLTVALSTPAASILRAYRRFAGAPKALWENKSFDSRRGTPHADPATALTEATIPNTLTGLTLAPYLDDQDGPPPVPVPVESLLFDQHAQRRLTWSPGVPPASDPFTDQTVADTVTRPDVARVRLALLDALAGQGVGVTTAVDVSRLASPAATDLLAAPRLRLLGEPPAAR
jgi:uncharacterized protein DUF6603